MPEDLSIRFAPVIRQLSLAAIGHSPLPADLLIDRKGDFEIYYAPFDHVNANTRVVLVGIAPGYQQMRTAILEFRRQLNLSMELPVALAAAKKTASLSGAMRRNLSDLLDYFQIHTLLGISSCSSLFDADIHQVHFTSLLRYPTFHCGCNYSGSPGIAGNTFLQSYLLEYFAAEAATLSTAIFVPLGSTVSQTLRHLSERGILDPNRVLDGLEHPSPGNSERIAYMLDRKPLAALSVKTNAARIDEAKDSLRQKVARLLAADRKQWNPAVPASGRPAD